MARSIARRCIKLLDLNATACNAAFAIDESDHMLLADRSCLDLDRREVRD